MIYNSTDLYNIQASKTQYGVMSVFSKLNGHIVDCVAMVNGLVIWVDQLYFDLHQIKTRLIFSVKETAKNTQKTKQVYSAIGIIENKNKNIRLHTQIGKLNFNKIDLLYTIFLNKFTFLSLKHSLVTLTYLHMRTIKQLET